MITIIGTGHIFDLSDRISRTVSAYQPDLVAVELDRGRYRILEMERRNRRNGILPPVTITMVLKPSPVPFRFRILAYVQRKLAAMNNVFPGEEMLSAIDSAREAGAKIALIDRDIEKTFLSLNSAMGMKEKVRFSVSLVTGFFGIGAERRSMGDLIHEMERDHESVITEIARQFPGLKRALIDERDANMARALEDLEGRYPRILVFVGDAHLGGISRLLAERGIESEVVHLHSFMKSSFFEAQRLQLLGKRSTGNVCSNRGSSSGSSGGPCALSGTDTVVDPYAVSYSDPGAAPCSNLRPAPTPGSRGKPCPESCTGDGVMQRTDSVNIRIDYIPVPDLGHPVRGSGGDDVTPFQRHDL